MIYVSVDTETTGLLNNPYSKVWQVSMIVEDTSQNIPIKELPSICLYVDLGNCINWESGALGMNIDNISRYLKMEVNANSRPLSTVFCTLDPQHLNDYKRLTYKDIPTDTQKWVPSGIQEIIKNFLDLNGIKRVLFAGKNVAGFDLPFLVRDKLLPPYLNKYHRVLDPSIGFLEPNDICPPALNEIIQRIPQWFKEKEDAADLENSHHSLDDARCIILAFRYLQSIGKVTF